MSRGIEREILPTVRELGIGVSAYGLLSRGLLGGSGTEGFRDRDIRKRFPRFQGEHLQRNMPLVRALQAIAAERKRTPAQLAVAWVLSRGADIVPLLGPRNREQLRDLLGALEFSLTSDELGSIESAVPSDRVSGNRYYDAGMVNLDSESVT
jgi:aryl-alcohol dehydrogenase-like predicted oxidoreductase